MVSLAVLLIGSDWFIDSAEKIGLSLGISPFIIGVTIVAFGTSLPELATSIASVLSGTSEIVIGNVIGSNIANILLVLGLTAIIGKGIKLDFNIMDVDVPLLLFSAVMLYFAVADFHFSAAEAIIFLIALGIFLFNSVSGSASDDVDRPKISGKTIGLLLLGGLLVYLGANYTIYAIEKIALQLNISPDIIALTVIAFGTSLPEVVVSISAAKKGKHAIAVGNVLGSNLFNTYGVMGIPGLMGNLKIQEHTMQFSMPFMLVTTVLFAYMVNSNRISKWEGAMAVLLYCFYIIQVIS